MKARLHAPTRHLISVPDIDECLIGCFSANGSRVTGICSGGLDLAYLNQRTCSCPEGSVGGGNVTGTDVFEGCEGIPNHLPNNLTADQTLMSA